MGSHGIIAHEKFFAGRSPGQSVECKGPTEKCKEVSKGALEDERAVLENEE